MSKKATLIGGLVLLTLFGLTTTSFAFSNDKLHVGSEAGDWYGKWQYVANDSETNTNISATGDDLRLHVGSEAGNWYGKWHFGVAEPNKLAPQEQTAEGSDLKCPMLTC